MFASPSIIHSNPSRRFGFRRIIAAWLALSILGTGVVFALDSHAEGVHFVASTAATQEVGRLDRQVAHQITKDNGAVLNSNLLQTDYSLHQSANPNSSHADQHRHSCHGTAHMLGIIALPLQIMASPASGQPTQWPVNYTSHTANPAQRPPRFI